VDIIHSCGIAVGHSWANREVGLFMLCIGCNDGVVIEIIIAITVAVIVVGRFIVGRFKVGVLGALVGCPIVFVGVVVGVLPIVIVGIQVVEIAAVAICK
jgi:hypothetical protein